MVLAALYGHWSQRAKRVGCGGQRVRARTHTGRMWRISLLRDSQSMTQRSQTKHTQKSKTHPDSTSLPRSPKSDPNRRGFRVSESNETEHRKVSSRSGAEVERTPSNGGKLGVPHGHGSLVRLRCGPAGLRAAHCAGTKAYHFAVIVGLLQALCVGALWSAR